MDDLIRLENVWKIYQLGEIELKVLKGVDFYVKKGEFIIIFGPSGSGKSTLLNIVSCLDVPTRGRVFLEGGDVSRLSEDELAEIRGEKIGFVFQHFNLLPNLTALDNVILPTVFQGVGSKERQARAKKLLASVGLGERMNHIPTKLSGGEKQRVAIARALVNDPEIVVADEPTGDVDSKTGAHIMQILEDLNKKQKKTVIVVTHDPSLREFAMRTVEIRDGRVYV